MRRFSYFALILLAFAAGCYSEIKDDSTAHKTKNSNWAAKTEQTGELATISIPASELASLQPSDEQYPVSVQFRSNEIICGYRTEGTRIKYLIFEQKGIESAYGVYALEGDKTGIPIGTPLDGDPVGWPDLDHQQALARLLVQAGMEDSRATLITGQKADDWFKPGLRIFFVMDSAMVESAWPQLASASTKVVLLKVELPAQ